MSSKLHSHFFIAAAVLSTAVLSHSAAAAGNAEDKGKDIKAEAAPSAPAVPSAPATHPITQAAVQSGVLSCASRINQVSSFLTANAQNSAQLYVAQGQPDQKIFSATMEVVPPNGPAVYATASFAPNQANGCGALYETVAYWPSTCDDLAKQQYAGLKEGPKLGQRTRVLLLGPSSRVFLMPAGTGCLAIKKEVLL